MKAVLDVKEYSVSIDSIYGEVEAVRDVSFSLYENEVLALVGESGCGKSVLCKSLMKLLPKSGYIKSGTVELLQQDITHYKEEETQKIRGNVISMILQDPLSALNPTMKIGKQIEEAITLHQKLSKQEVYDRVLELLYLVELDKTVYHQYPSQLSGGMRQRVVLAIAIASHPKILISDEATTALDVTIQSQVLNLLKMIQKQFSTSILFVTHDLGVVSRIADRVAIMYAGKIVEIGTVDEIFYDARHPYTIGLLHALPYNAINKDSLDTMEGIPPALIHPPIGDAFAYRNPNAMRIDYEKQPPMFRITDTHYAATWLLGKENE